MRHLLILISLLSTLSFIGCRDESDAIYLIDRAESLLKSDPDSSHILLDSIAVPDNLSDKLLARWCMLSGKVADTLYTDLPYVQQLLRAQAYYKSHGTKQEQAKIGLYLGRSYVEDKENEKAMKVYLQALDIALRSEDYNQAGYICSYMGDLYDFEGNYLLGKDKYKEAESYFRKAGNMRSSAFALRDVGRMYAFSDSLDIAFKSRKTKSDGREKRKAIFEAKTKCAQKSRLLPPSGQNTSVVQTPFESCLNDAFLLNFLLKYHLKTIANLAKNRIFT